MAGATPDFSKLDVYAFADAGSEEAKAFQTYSFYWLALQRALADAYGQDPTGSLVDTLTSTKSFRRLSASQYNGSESKLTHLLHNSWANELMLYVVDDDDPRLLTAVQWQNVYVYYATGMSALAWMCVRDGTPPKAHRRLLDGLATQISNERLFPSPWDLHLARLSPPDWRGFAAPPNDCSNLSSIHNVDVHDAIGKLLKTTRKKRVEEQCDEVRQKWGKLPNGERDRIDAATKPTTLFDFTWRSRTRANYGSPAMFFKGALGDVNGCAAYVNALRSFSYATMLVFEAMIGQKARKVLVESATEFMSRDRSQTSDTLVGKRLRELQYLK